MDTASGTIVSSNGTSESEPSTLATEGNAPPAIFSSCKGVPAKCLGAFGEHIATALFLKEAEPVFHRIDAGSARQLVDERFDCKNVGVGAEAASG